MWSHRYSASLITCIYLDSPKRNAISDYKDNNNVSELVSVSGVTSKEVISTGLTVNIATQLTGNSKMVDNNITTCSQIPPGN